MDETLDKLGATIAAALPGSVTGHAVAHGELTVTAAARDIVKVATFLRDDERCQFWSIVDVTGGGLAWTRASLRRRLSFPLAQAEPAASG